MGNNSNLTVAGSNNNGGLGLFGTLAVGGAFASMSMGTNGSLVENGTSNTVYSGATLLATIGGSGVTISGDRTTPPPPPPTAAAVIWSMW